jgi:class 3 adenylate cyclase
VAHRDSCLGVLICAHQAMPPTEAAIGLHHGAALRALRTDLIDPTIAVHNGRVVKRTGDGSLVELTLYVAPSKFRTAWSNATTGLPPERRIEFRVGHTSG